MRCTPALVALLLLCGCGTDSVVSPGDVATHDASTHDAGADAASGTAADAPLASDPDAARADDTTEADDTTAADDTAEADDTAGPALDGAGTDEPDVSVTRPPEPLDLSPSTLTIDGVDYPFAANVAYGPHARNVLDIAMPDSDTPTPLVLFIHGGGFVGGSKDGVWGDEQAVAAFLEQGVAFAASNYRLLETVDDEGVIKPLGDSRRALQYLRYHAASFGIDPARIVAFGSSAGAGTCLWLGTSDDMADPASEDPVERMSTRLLAVGAKATQASYDLVQWETQVFEETGLTLEIVVAVDDAFAQRLYSFYGVSSLAELEDPEIVAYRASVDMLGNMDADDAPIHVHNQLDYTGLPTNTNTFFHHALHARALRDRADAVDLEHVVYAPALEIVDPSGETLPDFLLRHLDVP